MFGTLSAAYKIWTAPDPGAEPICADEHAAAEAMLMTAEPQSLADIVLVLRTLAQRAEGADQRRLLQMSDYLDADAPAEA